MYQKTLNTILYNPSWWVKAYEVANNIKAPHLSPMELSCESGTSPAFSSIELSGLAIVMSNIQKQLLSGQTRIILDPVEHRKFVSSTAKHRVFAFERILQIMAGMQLLTSTPDEGFELTSLFKGQSWKRQGIYRGLAIEVELSELGSELTLGFVEPYSDLYRYVQKLPRVQRILNGKGPLRLWQSAWLDLQGIEQILLLRLEKAMQWENNWLRLDGVFGCGFEDLMNELEIPKARGKSSDWSPFRIKRRVVERLGRKLADHGLLNFDQEQDFIPFGDREDFSIVWQVASEYLNQISIEEYAKIVADFFNQSIYSKNISAIHSTLSGQLYNEKLASDLRKLWHQLQTTPVDDFLGIINSNIPVSAKTLFMEWFIRQIPDHKFSLAEHSRWADLFELADPKSDEDLGDRITRFCNILREDERILTDLEETSGLSFISPKTQRDPKSIPYFMSLAARSKETTPHVRSETIPSLPDEVPQKKEKQGAVAKVDLSSRHRQLKAAATEELERLRSEVPDQYEALKNAYINTLDPEKKKIIIEVRERLQPKIFDDHLKNSLIRYMIDQPESWISNSK